MSGGVSRRKVGNNNSSWDGYSGETGEKKSAKGFVPIPGVMGPLPNGRFMADKWREIHFYIQKST